MRKPFAAALAAGVGLAGTLDEVLFHQLLAWHHFYDGDTTTVGRMSDGVFHLASTALLVWGVAAIARMRAGAARRTWAGVLLGAGGFNLFDGTVQHKLLGLHQVRHVEDTLPYDVAFIATALLVVLAGGLLLRGAPPSRRRERR